MVLMRALFDVVIVETVGVGQSETEIADCADIVVFCAQPGSGDALQYMKAGVMEVPDVVLVTKGDLGAAARRAAADVRGALSLAADDRPPADVAIVSAQTGKGLDAALDLIAARAARTAASGGLAARRREQGRAWAESRLGESFGSVGRDLLAPRLRGSGSPFSMLQALTDAAKTAVHESLKEL
jgi:LAO/AO transport system kinase